MNFNLRHPVKFFPPIIAPLMEKHPEALILGGSVALQFGLVTVGLPGWPCPFKAAFGIPCPACGLSTAVGLLLHGDWYSAITTHAFAPVFLLGVVVVLGTSLLPGNLRTMAIQKIALMEKRTGITILLLVSLMLYWGFRLFKL